MKKLLLIVFMSMSITLFAQKSLPANYKVPVQEREAFFSHHNNATRHPATTVYYTENFDNGIPATWTIIDIAGTGAVWQGVTDYGGETLDGTPFAMADSDAAGQIDMDTELESGVINISNNGLPVYLGFDHYFQYYSSGGNEKGDVEVYDGTNWVLLARYEGQTYGSWNSPAHESFEVTSYLNPNFKVRFHYYDANYDWFWAVDNVTLYTPAANDLLLAWGIPYVMVVNEEAYFSTIVFNNGYDTQNTFNVSVEVIDANNTVLHTETVNLTSANLGGFESMKINFPTSWTPTAEEDYLVRYTVSLSGDEDTSNDTFEFASTSKVFVYNPNTMYSFITSDGDMSGDEGYLGYFDTNNGTFNPIDSVTGLIAEYFTGGDFVHFTHDPTLVGVDYLNIFYFVNRDGNAYPYGYVPFLGDVITGVAFPQHGAPYYSTINSLYMLTPYLDTLKIGDYNISNPLIVGIAMDNSGNLYGIDIGTNKLYSINTTDASLTEIGDLGVVINYIQDIGFDKENNVFYGTLMVQSGNNFLGGLYTIDVTTGQATPIGTPGEDEYSLCAYAPSNVIGTEKITMEDWKLYPNPASEMIHINWKIMPDQWQIIDINGKVLLQGSVDKKQQTIDISHLSAGTYWFKIQKGESISTKTFLKK